MSISTNGVVRVWLPILYLPVPRIHNPVVVVPTTTTVNVRIHTDCELLESNDSEADLSIDVKVDLSTKWSQKISLIKSLITAFLKSLARSISISGVVSVNISSKEDVAVISLYVVVTNEIVKLLAGELNAEILDAIQVIDKEVVGENDAVSALRAHVPFDYPYIWRYGEEPIVLDRKVEFENVSIVHFNDKRVSVELHKLLPTSALNALIHLSGMLTIEGFRALYSCDVDKLSRIVRAYNALWYMLYNVELSTESVMVVDAIHAYELIKCGISC